MIEANLKKKPRTGRLFKLGLALVIFFYAVVLFAGFIAPYSYKTQSRLEPSAPPTQVNFDSFRPYIYANNLVDARTRSYQQDTTRAYQIDFFVRGEKYKFIGLFETDRHLFGVSGSETEGTPKINLLGTDQLGRDRFSRLVYATQFSLIVSPLGTLLACFIGVLIGVAAGFASGFLEKAITGVIDAMLSLPTLILILAARAAFPLELPPLTASILLISIFGLTGWAEMARLARGLVWSMRQREFVLAAKASGTSPTRTLFRHILPNISMPLLVQMTLMFPAFLLAEIALSFLGIGLQDPEPSLGNLLAVAGDVTQLQASPIAVLAPAIIICIFVFGIRLLVAQTDKTAGLD